MANPAFRERWDSVANPKGIKNYPIDITEAVSVGDLMYWDKRSAVARPFSSTHAWTGSTAGTQAMVAENFVGRAMSAHPLPDDPKRTDFQMCRIAGRGVASYPLTTAAALAPGDLIIPSKDPSGNLLFAQQVDRGTTGDPGEFTPLSRELAIGKAVTNQTSASNAMADFEIIGTREPGGGPRTYLTS